MLFICFGILIASLIVQLYAKSLNEEKHQKILKYAAYGMIIFDILLAFFC